MPLRLALAALTCACVGSALAAGVPARSVRRSALWMSTATALAALAAIVGADATARAEVGWVPQLGLALAVKLDPLGAIFAALAATVGCAVTWYAGPYFEHDGVRHERTFYASMLAFTAAVLGCAYADNLLTLYGCWELSGIPSFLLIGYHRDEPEARASAARALVVTGGGGVALLVGALLLGPATPLDALSAPPSTRTTAIALLLVVAAATKSAQAPFHAWLPRAMVAPTPVSAFLHSAALVALGVLLLLRTAHVLDGAPLARGTLVAIGATSMIAGAVGAFGARTLKGLLAQSTISQYGYLFWIIGLSGVHATGAAVAFFVAHGLAKATLFLVAGAITHATHETELARLGGLAGAMRPWLAAACVAAASAAGIAPALGFFAKEDLLSHALDAGLAWTGLLVVVSGAAVAYLGRFVAKSFGKSFGGPTRAPPSSIPGRPMLAPVGILVALSIALAPLASSLADWVDPAPVDRLHPSLGWAAAGWALGLVLFALGARVEAAGTIAAPLVGGEPLLRGAARGWSFASRAAAALQSGSLRRYVGMAAAGCVVLAAISASGDRLARGPLPPCPPYEAVLLVVVTAAGIAACVARSSAHAVLAQAVAGYLMAGVFAAGGAPDVALVTVHVETLATVLFVVILARVRQVTAGAPAAEPRRRRPLHVAACVAAGATAAALTALAETGGAPDSIARWYAEGAAALGASDAVAAILVSYRALDTLGEITVFALSAAAVAAITPAQAGGPARFPPTPLTAWAARVVVLLALVVAATHLVGAEHWPGDGFTAGVIASLAVVLLYVVFGPDVVDRKLTAVHRRRLVGAGLGVALGAGVLALALGRGFLGHADAGVSLGPLGVAHVSSGMLFDLGVFFVVLGVCTTLAREILATPRRLGAVP